MPPQEPGQELVGQGSHKPNRQTAQFPPLNAPRLVAHLVQLEEDEMHPLLVCPLGIGEGDVAERSL
jgi:hypothetical protein